MRRRCLVPLRRQKRFLLWLSRGTGAAQRLVAHRCYTGVVRAGIEYASELYGTSRTDPALLAELDKLEQELVTELVGAPTTGVAHIAVRAEAGVMSLRERRRWAKLRLLSRVAKLGNSHRLGRLWQQRLDDGAPTLFFRDAEREWVQLSTPKLIETFGTERFGAALRDARWAASDAELAQATTATTAKLRQVKPTARPGRHTMLGSRRHCVLAAKLRLDVAPLAPRLRHFTHLADGRCTNCGGQARGPIETREHFLLECPRWGPQRARLESELTRYGLPTPPTIEVVLGGGRGSKTTKLAIARALHRYIAETGRFRDRRLNPDAAPFIPAAAGLAAGPAPGPGPAPASDEDEKQSVASLPLSQTSDGKLAN